MEAHDGSGGNVVLATERASIVGRRESARFVLECDSDAGHPLPFLQLVRVV
jgi:hypothetical protein